MNKKILTASLMGGLGNQLFQIAHLVARSIRDEFDYYLNPVSYTPMQANQPTKYLNNIFKNIVFSDDKKITKKVFLPFEFLDIPLPKADVIEFVGYCQSSKYFYGLCDNIKSLFQPNEMEKSKIIEKYPELKLNDTTSIHIRRGDYLTIPEILPTIDISYIESSLSKIEKNDKIFIFSDDIDWVRKNITFENVHFVDNLEDYEQLWMMSFCKNNIMSNSSFSWWGSFLNNNSNRKVFTPNIWFGPKGEKNINDIYQPDWIKINVTYKNGKLLCY